MLTMATIIQSATSSLKVDYKDWGQEGKHDHVTLQESGTVPTSVIARMPGKMDERPGEHRNRHGEQWEEFKADIAAHGIQHPIFICADWNERFYIYEGNHRRDAAVELGLPEVPVEVRYFGCADQQGTLLERRDGRPNFVANPVKKRRDGTIDPYA